MQRKNTQLRNLTILFILSVMVSACSNSPKIVSASEDKVILKAAPESYLDAYDMAKRECDKNARIAQYITDGTDSLNSVAFNCFDPNAEAEVVAEAEAETEIDVNAEAEAVTEEILEETPIEETTTQ